MEVTGFAVLQVLLLLISVPHILLFKSDHRASLGWLGLVFLLPVAGPLCYWLFGINRVRRKAQHPDVLRWTDQGTVPPVLPELLDGAGTLEQVGLRVSGETIVGGNRVEPLFNGEAAFPAMLAAIEAAQHEVLLSTFIFDDDDLGRRFVAALEGAMARGIVVAVLVDDLGRRFRFPTIVPRLRRAAIPTRRFMPMRVLPPSVSLNLRNHRKLLLVD
ncbi:MAG: PLDc N-terminal domain-containing protein, partial [Pseudomonadota bacterium]